MKKTVIYAIINIKACTTTADMCHKKTVTSVAAAIEEDHRLSMETIAATCGVYKKKKHFQHSASGPGSGKEVSKMGARLLNEERKQERVWVCTNLIAAIHHHSKSTTVTLKEMMVSYHTPDTKKQRKQWIPKGQPGPLKAQAHACWPKHGVFRL